MLIGPIEWFGLGENAKVPSKEARDGYAVLRSMAVATYDDSSLCEVCLKILKNAISFYVRGFPHFETCTLKSPGSRVQWFRNSQPKAFFLANIKIFLAGCLVQSCGTIPIRPGHKQ